MDKESIRGAVWRSRLNGIWHDFATASGRTSKDDGDYLRISLLNIIGPFGALLWGLFLFLNLFVFDHLEPADRNARAMVDAVGMVIGFALFAAIRLGCPVDRVARVGNGFILATLLALVYVRDGTQLAMTVPLIYPPVAFLLLDNVRRGIGSTAIMLVGIVALVVRDDGAWHGSAGETLDAALTVSAGLIISAAMMALYVHNRQRVLAHMRLLRSELAEQATRDPLTGVRNRRGLTEALEDRLAATARDDRVLAFLFLDVDGFKAYNDRHGHLRGDQLLKQAAGVLSATFGRAGDRVFRLGGDEFGVLYRAEDEASAERMADRLLAALASADASGAGTPIRASAGLCLIADAQGVAARTVIERVDDALHRAKRAGKGRWIRG